LAILWTCLERKLRESERPATVAGYYDDVLNAPIQEKFHRVDERPQSVAGYLSNVPTGADSAELHGPQNLRVKLAKKLEALKEGNDEYIMLQKRLGWNGTKKGCHFDVLMNIGCLEVYRLQSVDEQKRRSRRLAENRRMAVSPEARSTQHSTWFERQSLRAEKARILRKQLSLKSEKTKTLSLEQKALKEKYREEVRKNMRDFPGLQRVQRRWLLYIAITSRLSRWVEYMMATKSLSGDIFQRIEAVNIIKRYVCHCLY